MNEQKNKWMNEKVKRKNGCNKEQTLWISIGNEWINKWMNEWTNEWKNEWTNQWMINLQINIGRTVEWMNDRVCELKFLDWN